ncbi:MAG: YlxM family DNA-binding protein [Lachnospiraceae bacterium]|nr:YlxM family DNA-binding protein [Lachnospiraceae bacterium]
MEKIFEQALLYDFYGDLLTEHQRQVYEAAVFDDMSLGEIAAEQGITRQGVHDLIKRCDKILAEYEEKLHLVERFEKAKEKIARIETLTGQGRGSDEKLKESELLSRLDEIGRLTKDLMETL